MRRVPIAILVALVCATGTTAFASPARAAASWRLEQPSPPPPPAGVNPVDRPLGLGQVGDIEFWTPNRGLLITGGNPPAIPAGLWAYNGTGWHLLSTVCGSGHGRIAWAGPDDFWTISDPAPNSSAAGQIATTLCHFQNGSVVASYATPTGSNDPYQLMTAAACNGPSDCWFGGRGAQPPLTGAFHLHWDGTALTDVLGPQDRQIEGLAAIGGQFFESVFASTADNPVPPEDQPVLLHRIVEGVTPDQQFIDEPFIPSSDASVPGFLTFGSDGTNLWAAGGESSSVGPRPPMAARLIAGVFQPLNIDTTHFRAPNAFLGVAPEPGVADAWLTVGTQQSESPPLPAADVARIAADGSTLEDDTVPAPGSGQPNKGSAAGPIACPAANNCWMVTKEGWLFHYTDGSAPAQDTDSNFAGVIDQRPPDAGTATFYPDTSPLDDSLANQQIIPITPKQPTPKQPKPKRLVTHMRVRLRGTTLLLSFKLTERSHVSLAGVRRGRIVARTPTRVLAPGPHVLSLKLDRRRWPTKLKFNVVPVKRKSKAADTGSRAPANARPAAPAL
jgi:hypothetical protein